MSEGGARGISHKMVTFPQLMLEIILSLLLSSFAYVMLHTCPMILT